MTDSVVRSRIDVLKQIYVSSYACSILLDESTDLMYRQEKTGAD